MPNYTTSYSTKNKPRYRKNTNGRLSGARKPPRRRDAQYLRRTQGFGGRRRSGHGYGGNDRRPYAIIVVGCAFLLFVASIVWYANRSVEITLNGEAAPPLHIYDIRWTGEPLPNYTTSYSTKNKPRYRKNTNGRLSGARKPPRRRDAQYLRRTQGFGGRRRSGHGYGGNDRRPYAIIVVGCAFLLFVASIVWYANRSVEITLNGEAAKVRINSSIERVIREKELEPRPGNLLAVDDSVLEKGGGTACTVELNGKAIDLHRARHPREGARAAPGQFARRRRLRS